ncbi:hypothetical protein [Marinicella gelatinilytica]|uniref:hypothetical protein n=1 Tax=Marinicella gelatinilytica TaxID=2996017 RepID=UPI002260B015|nr:hypothetical protein [Marinicella gelatinilytica]MCX7544839.1 hypothetical protein [Marinicella gelatinilytica]
MTTLNSTLWGRIESAPLKHSIRGYLYSISEWPTFNVLEYQYEFILISAHLAYQPLSRSELTEVTGYQDYVVDYYLNTAYLLDILKLVDKSIEKSTFKTGFISSFTEKLKSVFDN